MNRRGMKVKSSRAGSQLIRSNKIPGGLLRQWRAAMKRSLDQQFREKSALRQEVSVYLGSFSRPSANAARGSCESPNRAPELHGETCETQGRHTRRAGRSVRRPCRSIRRECCPAVCRVWSGNFDHFRESRRVSLGGRRDRADECCGCLEFSESQRSLG